MANRNLVFCLSLKALLSPVRCIGLVALVYAAVIASVPLDCWAATVLSGSSYNGSFAGNDEAKETTNYSTSSVGTRGWDSATNDTPQVHHYISKYASTSSNWHHVYSFDPFIPPGAPGGGSMFHSASITGSVTLKVPGSGGINDVAWNNSRLAFAYDAPVHVSIWFSVSRGVGGASFNGVPLEEGFTLFENVSFVNVSLASETRLTFDVDMDENTPQPSHHSESVHGIAYLTFDVWNAQEPPPPRTGAGPDKPITSNRAPSKITLLVDPDDVLPSPWGPIAGETSVYSVPVPELECLPDFAYFSLPTQVTVGPNAGAKVTGFQFISEANPFTSFQVPELPEGTESLLLNFESQTVTVEPGQLVDFGAAGVTSFDIGGFNVQTASSAEDAFLYALRFRDLGTANFFAAPSMFIPPGDFDENGLVDGRDFLLWQRGVSPTPYSSDDLAEWQANYGTSGLSAVAELTGASVPEPTTLAFCLSGLAWAVSGRRFR